MILAKPKEYARGPKLDGEASRGKQAVDMNWINDDGADQGKKAMRRRMGQ